jgi:uncharacterized FlaG/YvyC family protein
MIDVSAIQGPGWQPVSPVASPVQRTATRTQQATPATPPVPPTPEAEKLRVEVENELQRRMSGYEVNLSYQEDVSSWVIQIRDPDSGDVVFQIPPEQMVRLRDRLQEVLKETGLLVDNTT